MAVRFDLGVCARLGLYALGEGDRPLDIRGRAGLFLRHRLDQLLAVPGPERLQAAPDVSSIPELDARIRSIRGEIAELQQDTRSLRAPKTNFVPKYVALQQNIATLQAMEAARDVAIAAGRIAALRSTDPSSSMISDAERLQLQTEFIAAQANFFRASWQANQMHGQAVETASHYHLWQLAQAITRGMRKQAEPPSADRDRQIAALQQEAAEANAAMKAWHNADITTLRRLIDIVDGDLPAPKPLTVTLHDPLPSLPASLRDIAVEGVLDLNDTATQRALGVTPEQLAREDGLVTQAIAAVADALGYRAINPFREPHQRASVEPAPVASSSPHSSPGAPTHLGLWVALTNFSEVGEVPFIRGLKSNVGLWARATYRPSSRDEKRDIEGYIVDENLTGVSILDPRGEVHHLANPEDIFRFEVAPPLDGHEWERVDLRDLDAVVAEGEKDVYAVIRLRSLINDGTVARFAKRHETAPQHERTLSGRLTRLERHGRSIYLIEDKDGKRHYLDPRVMDANVRLHIHLTRAHPALPVTPELMKYTPSYAIPTDTTIANQWVAGSTVHPLIERIGPELARAKNLRSLDRLREHSEGEDWFEKLQHAPGAIYVRYSGRGASGQQDEGVLMLPAKLLEQVPDGTILWGIDGIPVRKSPKTDLEERSGVTYFGVRKFGFNQLGDAVQLMDQGVSAVVRRSSYEKHVRDKQIFGRDDGQFMTTRREMDLIIREAKGDPQVIADLLGLGDLKGEDLVRIDVPDPWSANPRVPIPDLSGANSHYIPGGRTSGGIHEIVIDSIDRAQTKESLLGNPRPDVFLTSPQPESAQPRRAAGGR